MARPWTPDAVEELAAEAVVVRFGGSRYAVPMEDVAEVISVPTLTRVPGMPTWLAGVVNWRGRVLAVVDLRPIIGVERSPLPSSARLVVLTSDTADAALIVEAVHGLLAASQAAPQPVPSTVSHEVAALVSGVVHDGGPVSVMDVPAVLALRSSLPSSRHAI